MIIDKIIRKKEYGDYIVLNKESSLKILCKCKVCGNEKIVEQSNLDRGLFTHSGTNCKENYYNGFINNRYGDLIINKYIGNYKYECECAICKTKSIRSLKTITTRNIQHGAECLKQYPDDEYKTIIAKRFECMNQRCNNPNNNNYKHYGARGIKLKYKHAVDLYIDFIDELKEHCKTHTVRDSTFDRIDVDGDYEKNNLRITTQSVQSTNTTRMKIFIIEKDDERIISDSSAAAGKYIKASASAVGNLVRGSSKTCNGWKLVRLVDVNENLINVCDDEGVTTKLITTKVI